MINKQMAIIMVLLMTVFIGFGIIIPVLPELVTPFHLGIMLAVYSAASFLMSPIWGGLSDRYGRRPIILIGILGFSLSFFLFGISADSLVLMYVSRILGGLFSGAVTSCAVAYVADITSEENRTKGMGLVGMSIGLGFIFGPAIGGILSQFGYTIPFFASSLLALLNFAFAFVYLRESIPVSQQTKTGEVKTSRWKAFSGSIKYLYILGFLVSFTLAGLEFTLYYFEKIKIAINPESIGYMFLISGVVGALIQGGVVRKFIKKGDEQKVIPIGLFLSSLGFFLLLISKDFLTASIYLSVFAAGNALLRPCVTSLITQRTKVGQGVATGLSSSMDSLGRITGPLLASALYSLNINLPFICGGIICILAVSLLYRYVTLNKQKLPVEAVSKI